MADKQTIPPEIFRDLDLFNPERPPALGTLVMVLELNMIGRYRGRSAKGFQFDPVYKDIQIDMAAVRRALPPIQRH